MRRYLLYFLSAGLKRQATLWLMPGLALAILLAVSQQMRADEKGQPQRKLQAPYSLKIGDIYKDPDSKNRTLFHLRGELDRSSGEQRSSRAQKQSSGAGANRQGNAAAGRQLQQATPEADGLEQQALQFFANEKNFFSIKNAAEMRLHRRNRDGIGGSHLRFYRYLRGIRLYPMEVIAHFNKDGQLTGVNGSIVHPTAAMLAAAESLPGEGRTQLTPERVKDVIRVDLAVKKPIFYLLEPVFRDRSPYLIWRAVAGSRGQRAKVSYHIADNREATILKKQRIVRR